MAFFADFRDGVGFRCHPCEILEGPLIDEFLGEFTSYYKIRFTDVIPGTIDESQREVSIPACHIFDEAIELVDLPKECYWFGKYD